MFHLFHGPCVVRCAKQGQLVLDAIARSWCCTQFFGVCVVRLMVHVALRCAWYPCSPYRVFLRVQLCTIFACHFGAAHGLRQSGLLWGQPQHQDLLSRDWLSTLKGWLITWPWLCFCMIPISELPNTLGQAPKDFSSFSFKIIRDE